MPVAPTHVPMEGGGGGGEGQGAAGGEGGAGGGGGAGGSAGGATWAQTSHPERVTEPSLYQRSGPLVTTLLGPLVSSYTVSPLPA